MNRKINQLIDSHLGTIFPGCIIGIGGKNKKPHIIARGIRNNVIPVLPSDRFDIASLTKAILHYGVLKYAPEILDQPICDWITMTGKHRERITVRHLISFGVEYGTPPLSQCASKDEALRYILGGDLKYPPGHSWRYTNISSILLGKVIARHFDISLENFFDAYIFKPLDMKHTSYQVPESNFIYPEGECHGIQDEVTKLIGPNGSAGLVSTCADLILFGNALLDLPYEMKYAMVQPVYPEPYNTFGLGFGLWKNNEAKIIDGRGNIIPILRKNGFSGAHITIAPFHNTVMVSLGNICYPQRPKRRIREVYTAFTYRALQIALTDY